MKFTLKTGMFLILGSFLYGCQPPPAQRISLNMERMLRSEPLIVSEQEVPEVFEVDTSWRPHEYIRNNFEEYGPIVLDCATGLVWQKSGSDRALLYWDAQTYIEQLNQRQFAGYADWRLPTMAELISLLEPEKNSNGLYIDESFDHRQSRCWSSDRYPHDVDASWVVNFLINDIAWFAHLHGNPRHVRAVRP